MAYQLVKGRFQVKCGYPDCPFEEEVNINWNILGSTEEEAEETAVKFATLMAKIYHDSVKKSSMENTAEAGIKNVQAPDISEHILKDPIVTKSSGIYEFIDLKGAMIDEQAEAIRYKEYKKEEVVFSREEFFYEICEVVKGAVYTNKSKPVFYKVGDSFGISALYVNQVKAADLISAEDGTVIAFYNIKELYKKDLKKSVELYHTSVEDFFTVQNNLEEQNKNLNSELEKTKILSENQRVLIDFLFSQLNKE